MTWSGSIIALRALFIAIPWCFALPLAAQKPAESGIESRALLRATTDTLDATFHYTHGMEQMRRRRWDAADSAFRRAVALDRRFPLAALALAVAQDQNRRYWNEIRRRGGDSAIANAQVERHGWYRKAFLLDPFVDFSVLSYADARRGVAHPLLARVGGALALGDYPFLHRIVQDAERYFRSRAPVDVRDSLPPMLLWVHGLADGQLGYFGEAIDNFAALVRIAQAYERQDSVMPMPMLTNEFRYMLAAAHQRGGRRVEAIGLYREVLENDIGNYMAYVQLARLHEAGSEWSQAIRARQQAFELYPEDSTLLRELGATLGRSGRLAQAESILVTLQARAPLDPLVLYDLGVVQQALGRTAAARLKLQSYVDCAPARYQATLADARRRLAALQ